MVLLLLSSLIVGAGWPLVVEQISVKPNAAQKESEYISRSITATRQAYGLTDKTVTYRDYTGNAPATAQQVAADRATTSNIRVLDPTIVSPAFTQFQQGKNFYYFPDQLSIDRYNGRRRQPARLRGGRARTQPRPADRQPARLDQPAHRVHPRQRVHRLAGQHGARRRQRPQPERRLSGVPGQRRRRQRQRRLARTGAAGSAAHLLRPGHRQHGRRLRDRRQERRRPRVRLRDQHRDEELHLQRHRRRADRQLVDRAACSPRSSPSGTSCSPTSIGDEQQDPVQPRSGRAGEGGRAVADHRHQRVPGDREQADGVDRRRLHHAGQLSVLGADVAVVGHRRLQRGGVQPAARPTSRCPTSATR